MKINDELISITNKDLELYKKVFIREDYIKFLELLRDRNSKPAFEINTRYKELIQKVLRRKDRQLKKLLKDTQHLVSPINTITSMRNRVQRLNESKFSHFDEKDIPF